MFTVTLEMQFSFLCKSYFDGECVQLRFKLLSYTHKSAPDP